jgi:hypothetical protein
MHRVNTGCGCADLRRGCATCDRIGNQITSGKTWSVVASPSSSPRPGRNPLRSEGNVHTNTDTVNDHFSEWRCVSFLHSAYVIPLGSVVRIFHERRFCDYMETLEVDQRKALISPLERLRELLVGLDNFVLMLAELSVMASFDSISHFSIY